MPRGRGRPRKHAVPTGDPVDQPQAKRPVGRPRSKPQEEGGDSDSAKRPVGRPKKIVRADDRLDVGSGADVVEKSKGGRPRKYPVVATCRRKVGRPAHFATTWPTSSAQLPAPKQCMLSSFYTPSEPTASEHASSNTAT